MARVPGEPCPAVEAASAAAERVNDEEAERRRRRRLRTATESDRLPLEAAYMKEPHENSREARPVKAIGQATDRH